MSKKTQKKTLQEFLPALAAAAEEAGPMIARAALSKGADSMMGEEEEVDEIVGPSDGYRPDVSEAYLSMLESQLEEEGTLDEFLDQAGEMAGKIASTPMRMQAKAVKGFGKGLGLGEEQEIEEDTYPAQTDYPKGQPNFPRYKNALQGEGTSVHDEITVNRGADGIGRHELVDEEMYPKKKEYPQNRPYFPVVNKEASEEDEDTLDEETYPHQTEYPQNKPNFPRVVHVKKGGVRESFVLIPFAEALNENRMASMFQNFLKQASQILGQLDPEDLTQAGQAIMSMIQGLSSAKRQTAGGFSDAGIGESYIAEAGATPPPAPGETSTPEIQRWFQQFLSQKPPSVSDQQAQQITSQIMSQLGGGASQGKPTPPPPPAPSPSPAPTAGGAQGQGQVFSAPKGPSPYDARTYEAKSFVMTKDQLTDALKESIILHEKKKMVDRIVKNKIQEQVHVRNLCKSLLTEGPMSNMWQGVKNAGRAFAGGVQGGAQGAQQSVARGQMQDQAKQAQKMVSQAVKQVERAKSKFTQETLKNAGLINQYHDAVLRLVQINQQVEKLLPGPQLAQLQNQLQQSIGQLQYDLESEKSGIDTFLQSLSKAQPGKKGEQSGQSYTPPAPGEFPSAKELGKQARGRAEKQRAEENPPPSQTARLAASPGIRRAGKGKASKPGGTGR